MKRRLPRNVAKKQKKEKTQNFLYQSALQILESTENPRIDDHYPIFQDNSCNSSELGQNIHHSEADLFTIEENTSNYSRMAEDFDIKALVECTEYNRHLEITTSDDKIPLIKGDLSIEATTKSQFTRALIEFCEVSNLTESNQMLLLSLLHNSFGKVANLPVSQKQQINIENYDSDGTEDSVEKLFQGKNILSDLKYYQQQQEHKHKRFYSFNQCQNDCCLYIGKEKAKLFYCPTCTQPRFRPCTKRRCITRNKHDCPHLLSEGIAYKNLFYRSLILLIYDLVSTKYFIQYITYCRLHVDENSYSDVMDGMVAKGHLEEMDTRGNDWKNEDPINRNSAILVNLLLSEFYDGGQLFTSRMFDFWPLCFGILNLPANLRSKVVLGFFLEHFTMENIQMLSVNSKQTFYVKNF